MPLSSMMPDLTAMAVDLDEGRPSDEPNMFAERPGAADPGSWAERSLRLVRRLGRGEAGTALSAESATAVVRGLARAHSAAEGPGNHFIVAAELGGGADSLMFPPRVGAKALEDQEKDVRRIPRVFERGNI